MNLRIGKALVWVLGASVVMSGALGVVSFAQGRTAREPERRELEQRSGPDLDRFGVSIGASVRDTTNDEAQKARLSAGEGAVVIRLREGGPAEKAGVAIGDVIAEFDGERVRSARQLSRLVRESRPGRSVKTNVVRDGNRRTVEVVPSEAEPFGAWPDLDRLSDRLRGLRQFEFNYDGDGASAWGGWAFGQQGRLGARLLPVSEQLASYFGVRRGVLVSSVDADSPAGRAGLKAGDVVTAISGHEVDTPGDVLEQLRRYEAGETLTLSVTRDKKTMTISPRLNDERSADRPRRRRTV